MSELGSLAISCDDAVNLLSQALKNCGLQVTQSFDLQSARDGLEDPAACPCPYHGTAKCACQYVVLLVKRPGAQPVTLIVHGHNEGSYLSLGDSPVGLKDPETIASIRSVIEHLPSSTAKDV